MYAWKSVSNFDVKFTLERYFIFTIYKSHCWSFFPCEPWILPLYSLSLYPYLFCFGYYCPHRLEIWDIHLCFLLLSLPYIISLNVSTTPVTLGSFLCIPPSTSKCKALLISYVGLLHFLSAWSDIPFGSSKICFPFPLPSLHHSVHP